MVFFRQEYWSGLPCPPPGDLPNPRIKPRSPTLQEDSLPSEPPGKPKNTGLGSLAKNLTGVAGIELGFPALHGDSLPGELTGKPFSSVSTANHWFCAYPEDTEMNRMPFKSPSPHMKGPEHRPGHGDEAGLALRPQRLGQKPEWKIGWWEEGREGRKEKVKVLVTQSCSTLCNPMDYRLPSPFIHGILQAKTLEGQPFPSAGDLPKPGIKPGSLALQADSLPYELPGKPREGRGEDKIPSQVSAWSKK